MRYALDSNIIIDMIRRNSTSFERIDIEKLAGTQIAIPSIVDYEVQRGFYHTPSSKKECAYRHIKDGCIILEMNAEILDLAAQIWAKLKSTGVTLRGQSGELDLLIAAQCLHHGYNTIVTNNIKDFEKIPNLQIENWLEI
ncbi:MAG: PIN domain-containing protein [Firmicutes bacterium]|nr:PIN domain-containing protein [Bacillota bacterium]